MRSLFISPFKSPTVQLFILSGLLLIVLGGLRYRTNFDLALEKYQKELFWANKVENDPQYDFLVMGDSRAFMNIDPQILEDELGQKVFNFGFMDNSYTENYLKHYDLKLNDKAKNKTILLTISPFQLTNYKGSEHFEREIAILERTRFESRIFPLFQAVYSPIDFKRMKKSKKQRRRDTYHSNGYQEVEMSGSSYEGTLRHLQMGLATSPYRPEILESLKIWVQKWISEGVKVYVVEIPIHPKIYEMERKISQYKTFKVQRTLTDIGAKWLSIARDIQIESFDGIHYNSENAKILSLEISRLIKQFEAH